MKRLSFILRNIALAAGVCAGTATAGAAYPAWTAPDGTAVSLTCVYNCPDLTAELLNDCSSTHLPYGIMAVGGDAYISFRDNRRPAVPKFAHIHSDGTGLVRSDVPVVLENDPKTDDGYYFCGNDSEGNPFVCADSYYGWDSTPLAVYSVTASEDGTIAGTEVGRPTVEEWNSRDISIHGSVVTGTFEMAGVVKKDDFTSYLDGDTGLAYWSFKDGTETARSDMGGQQGLSNLTVQPLGMDAQNGYKYLLVHDSNLFGNSDNKYTEPTLTDIFGGELNSDGQLDPDSDYPVCPDSNGSHVFSFRGQTYIVYPCRLPSNGNMSYAVAHLPNGPHNWNGATVVWALSEQTFPDFSYDEYPYGDKASAVNRIVTVPRSDMELDIYILTACTGLAKYTMTDIRSTGTDIPSVTGNDDSPAEYYDLTGAPSDCSAPGVYIRRRGSDVRKILVR